MDLDLSKLGGQFSGARMGPCRVCRDLTVLPSFGDGRCFGCTSDEAGEYEWLPQKQIIIPSSEVMLVSDEVLELFNEAQQAVPAYKVIAGMMGSNGSVQVRRDALGSGSGGLVQVRREALWRPRRWGITPVSQRIVGGIDARTAISQYHKDLGRAHRAAGLCIHCVTPALPGLSACERHMARVKARYLRWKAEGDCLACGGVRDSDNGTCSACIARFSTSQRERAARLLAGGLCTACGQRPAAPRWCVICTSKKNDARKAKRRAMGPLQTAEEKRESARKANAARWTKNRTPALSEP